MVRRRRERRARPAQALMVLAMGRRRHGVALETADVALSWATTLATPPFAVGPPASRLGSSNRTSRRWPLSGLLVAASRCLGWAGMVLP